MSLVKFTPRTTLRDLDWFFEPRFVADTGWAPKLDIFEQDDAIVVRAEVPGVKAEDVDVTVEDRVLRISGSRKFEQETSEGGVFRKEISEGDFVRTIRLPRGVETGEVSAEYRDGILSVSVPKLPETLPKKVEVQVG